MGKKFYINGIEIREVTMANTTYHEIEYTNTIAEVKKHINKVCKKEGWLVSYFVWSKGEIDFKDTMMSIDIVTDIKDQMEDILVWISVISRLKLKITFLNIQMNLKNQITIR